MSRVGTLVPGGTSSNQGIGHPGSVAGQFYVPYGLGQAIVSTSLVSGRIYMVLGEIRQRIAVSQLGAMVSTVAAGGLFQLAIYAHNRATGRPGALIANTGSASTAVAGPVNAPLSANQVLEPGFYWFAHQGDGNTALYIFAANTNMAAGAMQGSATSAIGATAAAQLAGLSTPSTFGVWPADLNAATFTELTARAPVVQFLVASVP